MFDVASDTNADLAQEYDNEEHGEGQNHARAFLNGSTAAYKCNDERQSTDHNQQNRCRPKARTLKSKVIEFLYRKL